MTRLNVKKRIKRLRIRIRKGHPLSLDRYLQGLFFPFRKYMEIYLQQYGSLKCQLATKATLQKMGPDGAMRKTIAYFISGFHNISMVSNIKQIYQKIVEEIIQHYDAYTTVGSGWSLYRIHFTDVMTLRIINNVFAGNACKAVALPPSLKNKRCVFDVKKCPENCCFSYSVAASILNLKRPGKQQACYKKVVDVLKDVYAPMPLTKIPQFEKSNKIRVNVFTWEESEKCLHVLHHSTLNKSRVSSPCNLLLHENHFFVIRALNPLFSIRKRKYVRVCPKCYLTFARKNALSKHLRFCGKKIKQQFLVPPKGTYLKFENYKNQIPNPFCYYVDFETMAVEYNVQKGEKTMLKTKHVPVSFGAMRICENPKLSTMPYIYHGKNVIKHFIRYLKEEYAVLETIIDEIYHPIDITKESESIFYASRRCALCGESFNKRNAKMRDHNHLLPRNNFRYALCNSCNLNRACLRLSDIPIIAHNMSNFDSHVILADLHEAGIKLGRIRVVPHSSEKYLSFSLGPFKFIDSLKFLPASLKMLVRNLKDKDPDAFVYTRKLCRDEANFDMLTRKQPYPYTFAKRLSDYEYIGLPGRSYFRDDLKGGQAISDEDFRHANNIFNTFHCSTFLDFHKLYLTLDVTLLADVFETHRKLCYDRFQLDVMKYLSNAHFSFEAFLKKTKIQLELFSDVNMYQLIERGIRGGISVVSKKYSKANNPYLGDLYDPKKPRIYLLYVDATNLYGHAMSQALPVDGFQWVNASDAALREMLLETPDNAAVGYIACVDLKYPRAIHDATNDFPLAPEKLNISTAMLSNYSKHLANKLNMPKRNAKIAKLAPNLFDKTQYVVHYRNLRYYTQKGMIISKIHCVISFNQRSFMSAYIHDCAQRRRVAANDFERLYHKLCVNSLFGKFSECVRKRIDFRIVQTQKGFDDIACKPNLSRVLIFSPHSVGLQLSKLRVKLSKPIAVGFTILENAKKHMYAFHELMTTQVFPRENINLLFTDTDSLLYEIYTDDVYQSLSNIQTEWLDTSNYPKRHFLYDTSNFGVVGKFRDENPPFKVMPVEFIGLKSKMYSLLSLDGVAQMKAKGARSNCFSHAEYTSCLHERTSRDCIMYNIRSYKHSLYTTENRKNVLNSFDDKRYVLDDGINTLAHGHYKTLTQQ